MKSFKKSSKQEWLSKVVTDLKGKPIEGLSSSVAGIDTTPFYHKEDIDSYPTLSTETDNKWSIVQRILVNEGTKAANDQARQMLTKGADALIFIVKSTISTSELSQLLDDIQLEWISISFSLSADQSLELIDDYITYITTKSYDPQKVNCSFTIDASVDFDIQKYSKALPLARFYTVRSLSENDIDDKTTESLCDLIHSGNNILKQLSETDIDASDWNKLIRFEMVMSDHYFLNIVKLRALKILWQQVLQAWNATLSDYPDIEVHITDQYHVVDQNINTIKATSQAMAAVIGGADRLCIHPSDDKSKIGGTDFSRRIALNINHVMMQESHLSIIEDPAAGSYYIESLTDEIAEAAWVLFQKRQNS